MAEIKEEEKFTKEKNPMFFKLWALKNVHSAKIFFPEKFEGKKEWHDFEIYAKTTKDITMSVWNGKHNPSVEANEIEHICKEGTRVRVWMVSRFGDVGITDNLKDPNGYDVRVDADKDLKDYEFIPIKK